MESLKKKKLRLQFCRLAWPGYNQLPCLVSYALTQSRASAMSTLDGKDQSVLWISQECISKAECSPLWLELGFSIWIWEGEIQVFYLRDTSFSFTKWNGPENLVPCLNWWAVSENQSRTALWNDKFQRSPWSISLVRCLVPQTCGNNFSYFNYVILSLEFSPLYLYRIQIISCFKAQSRSNFDF